MKSRKYLSTFILSVGLLGVQASWAVDSKSNEDSSQDQPRYELRRGVHVFDTRNPDHIIDRGYYDGCALFDYSTTRNYQYDGNEISITDFVAMPCDQGEAIINVEDASSGLGDGSLPSSASAGLSDTTFANPIVTNYHASNITNTVNQIISGAYKLPTPDYSDYDRDADRATANAERLRIENERLQPLVEEAARQRREAAEDLRQTEEEVERLRHPKSNREKIMEEFWDHFNDRFTPRPEIAALDSIPDPVDSDLPYQIASPKGLFRNSLLRLYKNLYKITPDSENQQIARTIGLVSIVEADKANIANDDAASDFYSDLATGSLDLAIGLNPATALARSVFELFTGTNFVTGEELSSMDRTIAAIDVLTGGTSSTLRNAIKIPMKIAKMAKSAKVQLSTRAVNKSLKAGEKILENAGKAVNKLTPEKIRNYLSNADIVPRENLIKDIESLGLRIKGRSKDGRFTEFIDKKGRVRAKIHPPDNMTEYHHLHIYDRKGNSLNKVLDLVSRKSSEAHIPVQGI